MSAAAFANLIPSLPDFAGAGMNYAIGGMTNERYKRAVRHLRRREYQDMVFSLKQAGLNPLLATGASPGHANVPGQGVSGLSSGAGIANAMAQLSQADTARAQSPSVIGKNQAGARRLDIQNWLDSQQLDLSRTMIASNTALNAANAIEAYSKAGLNRRQMDLVGGQLLLMQNQATNAAANAHWLQTQADYMDKWGKDAPIGPFSWGSPGQWSKAIETGATSAAGAASWGWDKIKDWYNQGGHSGKRK